MPRSAPARAVAYGALLVLVGACGFGAPDEAEPPPPSTPPAPSPPPAPVAMPEVPAERPTLTSEVTGVAATDPNVTIDRCEQTGWSYHACDTMFPVQGRAYVAWACRHGEPRFRSILCNRWGEYLRFGVGGPVERAQGLQLMQEQCDADDRVACASLAEALAFEDLPRARAARARGCDEDPSNAPVGLCRTLSELLGEGGWLRTATVTSAEGLEGVTAGGQCRVWVSGRETCHGRVECGRHTVYGRGSSSFPCEVQGAAVRGGEDMVTATDGDAAFRVDSGAGTLTVHDDASGPLGAFSVSARLDPPG